MLSTYILLPSGMILVSSTTFRQVQVIVTDYSVCVFVLGVYLFYEVCNWGFCALTLNG